MSIPRPANSGYAIFCDDIREEINGKTTYVGVYGGDMLIAAAAPVVIPQLCCLVQVLFDPDNLPESANILLKRFTEAGDQGPIASFDLPPLASLPKPEYTPGFGDEVRRFALSGVMKMSPFGIEEPCSLRAIAVIDGVEHRLGNLHVRLVDDLPLRQ